MFDKFQKAKELLKLRQQVKKVEEELKKVVHTEEKDGVKVSINGAMKVTEFEIDGKPRDDLKDLINKAIVEVRKKAYSRALEMSGGLAGLLGKL